MTPPGPATDAATDAALDAAPDVAPDVAISALPVQRRPAEPATRPSATDRRTAHAERAEQIADRVVALEPGLDRVVVLAVVEATAVGHRARVMLLDWLTANPTLLTAAAPEPDPGGAPKVVDRFSTALVAAGAQTVRRHHARRRAACGVCGRTAPVKDRTPDGIPRCGTCRRRDTSTWKPCSGCGRTLPVNARASDGGALCVSCYQTPRQVCSLCGVLAPVAAHRTHQASSMPPDQQQGPVCASCYQHPVRPCGGCGRTRRVAVRGRDCQPDLCPTCHQAPVLTCSVCGTQDRCRTTTADKSPICFRCQLTRRLDQVLTGPDGTIAPALQPLRTAILAADNPRTPLGWLSRSPARDTLTQIAAGHLPLTHHSLDQAADLTGPASYSVEHLRQLLVATGALPDRDPHLPRLERRITHLLAALPNTLPAVDRQTLTGYAPAPQPGPT